MIQVIILAAGHGKRMGSEIPKPLIKVGGKPIIKHLLDSIEKSGICPRSVVVIGQGAEMIREELGDTVDYVYQKEQLGTGHAVAVCRDFLKNKDVDILTLYGDQPFLKAESIKKLADLHQENKTVITMMTTTVNDFQDYRQPLYDYGRIIRDKSGQVKAIIEKKDCTPEQLEIKEVNPGYYCFQSSWLWQNIDKLKNDNVQQEYYLTDLVKIAIDQGYEITTINIGPKETLGVNTAEQLAVIKKIIE